MTIRQEAITCEIEQLEQTLARWWADGARLVSCTPMVWTAAQREAGLRTPGIVGITTGMVTQLLLVCEREVSS